VASTVAAKLEAQRSEAAETQQRLARLTADHVHLLKWVPGSGMFLS
jgi:hypothetical protein